MAASRAADERPSPTICVSHARKMHQTSQLVGTSTPPSGPFPQRAKAAFLSIIQHHLRWTVFSQFPLSASQGDRRFGRLVRFIHSTLGVQRV